MIHRLCLITLTLLLAGCHATPSPTHTPATGDPIPVASVALKPRSAVTFQLQPPRDSHEQVEKTVSETSKDQRIVETGNIARETWKRIENGWGLASEIDRIDGVRLTYDPPMPLLPDRLAPGNASQGQGSVKIVNLENGSTRESGSYETRVTIEDLEHGFRLTERRKLDLRLANVTVITRIEYDDRNGLVDQQSEITTQMLGLFPNTEERAQTRQPE